MAKWAKSSFSFAQGDCVEVRRTCGHNAACVEMRDSKNPNGPVLTFTDAEWDAFLKGAKAGEFDLIGDESSS